MSGRVIAEVVQETMLGRVQELIAGKTRRYANASPFPHLIIDDFLPNDEAHECARAFPFSDEKTWTNYVHVNERKYGLDKRSSIPSRIIQLIEGLQNREFVQALSTLTSIPGLIADEQLTGGGLHQIHPGGFLNIHSDFLIHPLRPHLERRINLILFLSDDWQESYGGDLELWNKEMTQCVTRIAPKFNRCVIFTTNEYSYHGCPEKLMGPPAFSRKSLALYYYTEYANAPEKQFTNYQARPGDKRFLIWLDNQALVLYSLLKRKLKLNDDIVSKLLRLFRPRR
jgi:hypothetical protein